MHRDPAVGLSPPDGHQQSLECQVRCYAGLSGPTHHAAGEEIQDDAEIQPAFVRPQIGDVGHPDLIGLRNLELLRQPVLNHHRRLAAISAGAPPVADLRGDPGQGCKSRHPVLGDAFALVAQVIRQLAITIHLAAVGPDLADQLGLARVLLRTAA